MELEETIDRFRGPLTGLILSWGAPPVDAIEMAQDSMTDAYLHRDRCTGNIQDPEVFGRWLRGVAKNKYSNWARSRSRRERRVVLMSPEELADKQNQNSQSVSVDPAIQRLRDEIERLPKKQREVVLMHYLDESSVADVAAILSVTPKAVEGRLYQARLRLRKRLTASASSAQFVKAILL